MTKLQIIMQQCKTAMNKVMTVKPTPRQKLETVIQNMTSKLLTRNTHKTKMITNEEVLVYVCKKKTYS